MKTYEPLTDLQWEQLKSLFPAPQKRGRGKPHSPWRAVLNSVLFVLLAKAKWGSWPKTEEFASKSAAHRWYLHWDKNGLINHILALLKDFKPDCEIALPQRRFHAPPELEETPAISNIPVYLEIEAPEHVHI